MTGIGIPDTVPGVQATIAQQVQSRWGNELRMERERHRLKQSQVAERAGVSQSVVSDVEAGRGSFTAIVKIAAALGVTLSTDQADGLAS